MTYTENWSEVGTMCAGGDVGGDLQDSESYSRRFICQPLPGEFHIIDFNVYWARTEDEFKFGPEGVTRWIQTQVYYGVCTDPDDVGGTETYADYRYWDGDLRQSPDDGPREVCLQLGAEDLSEATSQMGA